PVALDRFIAPGLGEGPRLLAAPSADGLENGHILQVEEVVDLAVRIGMGPAHEAIADHPDVQRFPWHVLFLPFSMAFGSSPVASEGEEPSCLFPPAVGVAHLDHGAEDGV